MRRSLIALLIAGIAAVASPAIADSGFEIGGRGTYWFPKIDAQVQTFSGGVATPEFDVKNDLGIKDENFPSGEVFVRFGRVTIRAGYTPVKFDGSARLTRSIVFNGTTYDVNDNVTSHLEAKMIDGEIQVDLLRPDMAVASFNLGLLAKVKYVDGEVEIQSATAGTEKRDFSAPVPMVGLAAGAGFLKNMIRVDVRAAGMA